MGERFHAVLIAPTYNHSGSVLRVLRQLDELGLPVIAINDGSVDGTGEILAAWSGARCAQPRVALTHERNLGKAAALRTGFEYAHRAGYTHGITIDTDGQHDASDVPGLVDLAREHPNSLIVGARPAASAGYPVLSRLGRRISNWLIRVESGVNVSDSQCGLRIYPLEAVLEAPTFAGRFGFETEIITRLAWAGYDIRETDIRCIYEVAGGRLSHFRPVRDSLAAVAMHARLRVQALEFRALGWSWQRPAVEASTAESSS